MTHCPTAESAAAKPVQAGIIATVRSGQAECGSHAMSGADAGSGRCDRGAGLESLADEVPGSDPTVRVRVRVPDGTSGAGQPPAARSWTGRPATTLAATALAFVLALSVYLINGAPLFYHDTGAYLAQGHSMVEALGLIPADVPSPAVPPATASTGQGPAPPAAPSPSPGAAPELVLEFPPQAEPGHALGAVPETGSAGEPAKLQDRTVDASRSAVYALGLTLLDLSLPIDAAMLVNLALIWAAALLVSRRFTVPGRLPAPLLAAIALIAASLGALPFYVASLMPDILAPVLLLMIALLCSFWPALAGWERALAAALTVLAILCHPSHLLTAAILLPLGLFASPLLRGHRLAVAGGLALAMLGIGVLERVAFVAVVERLEARETRVLPFLTARLVADGPGLAYLEAECPDPQVAACALLAPLSRSTAPARLLSANILFSRTPETGSFALLDRETQRAISAQQIDFARRVFAVDPRGAFGAFAGNILTQLRFVRADMTLPLPGLREALQKDYGGAVASLRSGVLVESDRAWLGPLALAHAAVYTVSAAALGFLVLFPFGLPAGTRTFLLLIFAGLLVHAAVCGGLSVPAHRYGARVALVLPLIAGLLLLPALQARAHAPPREAG